MQMDSRIILAGQQPDFVNVLRQSNFAADEANQVRTQNALRELYQTQGPQIAAGEQSAMNALSRFDPKAALGIQGDRQGLEAGALGMDATRLGMDATRQRMDVLGAQEKRAIQDRAAQMSAEERAATAEKVQQGLMTGIQLYEAGDLPGLNAMLQSVGEQPIQSLDQFPGLAVKYDGVLEALKDVREFNKPAAPLTDAGQVVADQRAGYLPLDLPPEVDFDTEQALRKEFLGIPAVKAFSEQAQAFDRIVNSASDPSPAGDLALIFNFMKVLDPGSVVRESEFETAAQATAWLQKSEELGVSVPQPIAGAIRKMQTGQRLAPEQRKDFVGRARSLYDGAERGFDSIKTQYEEKAEAYNLDPTRSLADFRSTGQPTEPPAVSGGYQFKDDDERTVFEKYSPPSQ